MITPTAPLAASAATSPVTPPVTPVAPQLGTGTPPASILPPAAGRTPSLLPPRSGPALLASLLLPLAPPRTVTVPLLVSPAPPGMQGRPGSLPDLPSLLASLVNGDAIPAIALPPTADGRARLASGPLEVRLPAVAADLPAGTVVEVRLAPGRDGRPEGAAELLRAVRDEPDAALLHRLAPDARLATSLRAAVESLFHHGSTPNPDQPAVPTAPGRPSTDFPPVLLLGDPQQPVPVRIEQERHRAPTAHEAEAEAPLTLDMTFGRLGRMRLEVRAHGRGEVALSLRAEQALPPEARDRLRDLVGAAFELGGRPAWFMILTGPIPAAPPAASVVG